MASTLAKQANLFFHRMVRMHPAERGRDLWFQEEAYAERLSNFIRIVYILAWLISTAVHAPGNEFWSNVANLGVGGAWFLGSIAFQIYLIHNRYQPGFKYFTTTIDMVVITLMIWLYQFAGGPSYALKVPTFFNYYCCIGLAALRFRRGLVMWGGALAAILFLSVFLYFWAVYPIEFGTNIEHTTTSKINAAYIVYQLVYLAVFSFLTTIAAYNVKRLLELRVRENENALRAQERAVVAAGVAHEIKNPLEGIYGAAQLLQEEGKGNPRFIQMILKDSVRLNEVVQQFLRFARPFSPHLATFDLVVYLQEFCREQNEISQSALKFGSDVPRFEVTSDEEGLRHILLNLIQNGRRYQNAELPLHISVQVTDEVAEIHVDDEGSGVPVDKREKLFEPFFTTSVKGTGLGLAISRKIARELGGDLYYEALEKGSRFTILVRNHPSTRPSTKAAA